MTKDKIVEIINKEAQELKEGIASMDLPGASYANPPKEFKSAMKRIGEINQMIYDADLPRPIKNYLDNYFAKKIHVPNR